MKLFSVTCKIGDAWMSLLVWANTREEAITLANRDPRTGFGEFGAHEVVNLMEAVNSRVEVALRGGAQ